MRRWSRAATALGLALLLALPCAAAPPSASAAADLTPGDRAPVRAGSGSLAGAGKSALTFLEWDAPEGCPDRAAVYQRSLDAVGYPPERGRFDRVRGVVAGKPGAWLLTLELSEGERRSTRSIEAAACAELAGAAAVAIALALGAEGPAWDEAPSAPPPAAQAGSASRLPLDAAPSDDRPAPRSRQAIFALEAIFDASSLSSASFGAGVDVRFAWDALEIGARAVWLPPVREAVRAGESVQFELITLGPRLCYRALEAAVVGALCAGGDLGRFSADGGGLSRNSERLDKLWISPAAGVELRSELIDGVSARVGGEVLRPLLRERYTVNGDEVVYRPPDVGLRVHAGVMVSTP